MRIYSALLTMAALTMRAFAAEYSLDLDPGTTTVQFTLSDVLHTIHGAFHLKSGKIGFDTDTGKASGRVVVDVTSGNSGSEARDSRMHIHVLESKKYPEAIFVPSQMEGTPTVPGSSNVRLRGTLTIHGAAHEITMDVRTSATAEALHATMTFDIPYVAWGMKDPSNFLLKVSKTAQMSIEAAGPLQKH